ncbi:protein RTF1 homolog [Amaranthus tricolor]|uniref:protein RTF1 homolog n=1 Tax=Amaranthus tricolor TaxID=29722 RepID=UPI00258F9D0C|nr:protein RTF1 homolog [Amaranthus tricolor]XP_057537101.1 protein RTF1 homolog [Amaranthus tricolor]XP_057537110.1 protein RTF1 homolog [Amaranthus tricolor]XP_057537113.1 protein RTF1 homolog [Amaranthus tricolor]XP_057537119.1 protein RTF1 homolog [Amaranthus tricolor]XP_057537128.1 protein RTF1 homolog [Amaranthus tricolor]XP_057537137.1 protein RTF1 homolog [Amaranthus tricolor]XP_057537146.1 protein RTF1 homolog [Amaranthus tricolor]XP_057537154.1 protein RTF1 homolog [Amaranthus tri
MSGADLENMLLEAAGRTGASRRKNNSHPPSKRRHKGSYSDNGSDSKDDNSDDNHGHANRKLSGSQVPLKKRSKKDDGQGSDDDMGNKDWTSDREAYSSDDSDTGSDLYKDEDDREELSKLTELEREMILSDRAAKRDDKKLHKQMRSRLISEKKTQSIKHMSPPTASRGVRSSARSADRAAAKADALKELKARRMKRDPEGKLGSISEHHVSREYSPKKRKGVGVLSSGSSSESENGSDSQSDDEGSTRSGGMDYSDEERDKTSSNLPTYEQIKSITIMRSKLAKWFMEPFFEKLIIGCFVRVGIGMKDGQSIYRLCMVQNVDASDPNKRYQLQNKTTHKYLNCVWGSDRSAARWQMARISDAPPTLEEFNEWRREVERSGGRMPHSSEVQEKEEAISKINSFVYSAETVKQMLQEKKSISARPMNIAAEKEKLRRELDVAVYRGEVAEVERIKARLQELEKARQGQERDLKALKLAEMNKKNRAENFRVSSMRAVDRSLNPGDAGYDPFSRRWTRSTNYFAAIKEDKTASTEEAAKGGGVTDGDSSDPKASANAGFTATAEALEAAAGAGKLVDTRAPVDKGTESNTLHDFDLPISLKLLNRFGGVYGATTAFLARKQKIEASIGCQVPVDDGRTHAMTLSVGDYKRRRGLL